MFNEFLDARALFNWVAEGELGAEADIWIFSQLYFYDFWIWFIEFIDALAVVNWVAEGELGAEAEVWNFLTVVSLWFINVLVWHWQCLIELPRVSSVPRLTFEFSRSCIFMICEFGLLSL